MNQPYQKLGRLGGYIQLYAFAIRLLTPDHSDSEVLLLVFGELLVVALDCCNPGRLASITADDVV